jgi:hypothetical protein
MASIINRRVLGPVKTQMGGNTGGSSDSGGDGDGSSLTINNNVSGHVLKSIGSSNTITGHATSAFPANTLLSGAYSAATGDQGMVGDFSALYVDGIGADGSKQRYQLVLSGGILQTKEVDAR